MYTYTHVYIVIHLGSYIYTACACMIKRKMLLLVMVLFIMTLDFQVVLVLSPLIFSSTFLVLIIHSSILEIHYKSLKPLEKSSPKILAHLDCTHLYCLWKHVPDPLFLQKNSYCSVNRTICTRLIFTTMSRLYFRGVVVHTHSWSMYISKKSFTQRS